MDTHGRCRCWTVRHTAVGRRGCCQKPATGTKLPTLGSHRSPAAQACQPEGGTQDGGSQCPPRPAAAKSERGESGPAGPKSDTTIRGEKTDSRHTCNMHHYPPPADKSGTNQHKYMQRRSLEEDTADQDGSSSHKKKRLARDVWRMGAPQSHGKGLSHLCRLWFNEFYMSYW